MFTLGKKVFYRTIGLVENDDQNVTLKEDLQPPSYGLYH